MADAADVVINAAAKSFTAAVTAIIPSRTFVPTNKPAKIAPNTFTVSMFLDIKSKKSNTAFETLIKLSNIFFNEAATLSLFALIQASNNGKISF